MKYRTIVGLLIVLIFCSCAEQTTKGEPQLENDPNQHLVPKSGLLIDNGINRGISYTDPQGTDYSIRYIPITIANDSTIRIHLQIAFSKEYNYPHPDNDEFKLIPLPKEWALDGVGVTEGMIDELPKYIDKPLLNETIEPGEKMILAIGSLYPRPAKTTGVLPRILFSQGDTTAFPECDWLMEEDKSSNHQIPLELKIIFGERCMIIRCGQISYAGN